jgi:purine-binding chemotaxis protein CheW
VSGADESSGLAVLCRVGSRLCALPIEHVAETMRPLPLEPLLNMPTFILGLSIIRGAATPVVHAGRLLGAVDGEPPTRLLTLKVGERRVALAVDAVVGIRDLAGQVLETLPPLLQEAAAEVVSAVGTLDAGLLLLLRSARIVPERVWPALESQAGR